MCCRFYLPGKTNPEYNEIIEEIKNPNALIKTSGEIFPTDTVPVIANDKNMHPAVFGMKWGYSEFGKLIFNARSESAATSKLYSDGFNNRRCLIPVQCYYEWDKQKQKYKIGAANSDLIYLAGVYRLEGKTPVFSILTKNPVSAIGFIHDRMPVIFPVGIKKCGLPTIPMLKFCLLRQLLTYHGLLNN